MTYRITTGTKMFFLACRLARFLREQGHEVTVDTDYEKVEAELKLESVA